MPSSALLLISEYSLSLGLADELGFVCCCCIASLLQLYWGRVRGELVRLLRPRVRLVRQQVHVVLDTGLQVLMCI